MDDTLINMMSRKNKLEKSLKTLEKRMSREKREYDELSTAIEVMERFGLQVDESGRTIQDGMPPTIGDMVLEVLKAYPEGLTANQLLKEIQNRWKPELVRTSLSPPLSRLKKREEVAYIENNAHWKLPSNNEAINTASLSSQLSDELEDEIPF